MLALDCKGQLQPSPQPAVRTGIPSLGSQRINVRIALCKSFLISRLGSLLLFLALVLEASTYRLRVIRQLDYVHRNQERSLQLRLTSVIGGVVGEPHDHGKDERQRDSDTQKIEDHLPDQDTARKVVTC